jgi:sucrose-6F-phosphate phosphohydrolase
LVSDVDHTLLGNDRGLAEFADWFESVRDRVRLAYNSGRFYESVEQSIRTSDLPRPDAIIGGVGTDIQFPPDGERLADWPPTEQWGTDAVRAVLSAHKELEPQPEHLLSEFKISYFGYDLSDRFIKLLRAQLADLGWAADVVYSSNRDLDVLPAGTNKGTAAARLAQYWNIESASVIVAGDSGNDVAMFGQGFRGIVVANAHEELKSLKHPSVYHAQGECAAGVLEGMRYWLNGER